MSANDDAQAWRTVINFAGRNVPLAIAMMRVQALASAVEEARFNLVDSMRDDGWSWVEIGEALGMSRQGARQKFGGQGIA